MSDESTRPEPQSEFERTQSLRIIDAAANRAREGLRVVEDYTRFALDDPHLTRRLKECRHDLRAALAAIEETGTEGALLRARDTQSDVGVRLTTEMETTRESPFAVAVAAFKRAQEALRSLEEFGKLWSATAAARFKQLRYELYTLEKGVVLTHANRGALQDRHLYLLVSESLCRSGWEQTVRGALSAGVTMIQLREKSLEERKLVEMGRRVRAWTRDAGALFVMNDRPDLAVLCDADGVHVGQDDLPVKEARSIVGPDRLVGVSTHTIEQVRQAVLDGADYLGVGPVFPSTTKRSCWKGGLEFVREVSAEISLPWFAIGGIQPANLQQVIDAGARRVAISSAICDAADPIIAARLLAERLVP